MIPEGTYSSKMRMMITRNDPNVPQQSSLYNNNINTSSGIIVGTNGSNSNSLGFQNNLNNSQIDSLNTSNLIP